MVPKGRIRDANDDTYWGIPYYLDKQGPDQNRIVLNWERPVRGEVTMRVRMDDPI